MLNGCFYKETTVHNSPFQNRDTIQCLPSWCHGFHRWFAPDTTTRHKQLKEQFGMHFQCVNKTVGIHLDDSLSCLLYFCVLVLIWLFYCSLNKLLLQRAPTENKRCVGDLNSSDMLMDSDVIGHIVSHLQRVSKDLDLHSANYFLEEIFHWVQCQVVDYMWGYLYFGCFIFSIALHLELTSLCELRWGRATVPCRQGLSSMWPWPFQATL